MKQSILLFLTVIHLSRLFANEAPTSNVKQDHASSTHLYDHGHLAKPKEMLPGYNAPAGVNLIKAWDIYASGSFLYWQAREEGLELAIGNPTGLGFITMEGGSIIGMRFKFKPGFRLDFGFNMDKGNYALFGKYTRFHSLTRVSTVAPNLRGSGSLTPLWRRDTLSPSNLRTIEANGKWKLKMDLLDFEAGRAFYVGTKLTFFAHMGLRAAWIDQRYEVEYLGLDTLFRTVRTVTPAISDTWGIGPRIGVDTNWLLGYGIRFFGNLAFNLPYTRNKARLTGSIISNSSNLLPGSLFRERDKFLRPSVEALSGIGWGTYLPSHKGHIDLLIAYEFHQFWNQNLMSTIADGITTTQVSNFSSTSTKSMFNLYLQGLTASARFDF